mgnify:CR=1 FL=1|tara:strand:+ start:131 stop:475 length:345 start_codon:yes stop_codon:yes gene_type:complete
MAAVYVSNIVINSGVNFSQVFFLDNTDSNSSIDLTNYNVKSQMRKHSGSSNYVNFDCNIEDPSEGKISIGLSTSITSSLRPGRYLYDIVITDPYTFIKTRVVEGMVLVREGVTR